MRQESKRKFNYKKIHWYVTERYLWTSPKNTR
jgi:hypothetical protein